MALNTYKALAILAFAQAAYGAAILVCSTDSATSTVEVSFTAPSNASGPIPPSFVSFSIELAFWPEFGGNKEWFHPLDDMITNSIRKQIFAKYLFQQPSE